jgi:hypothetical protein
MKILLLGLFLSLSVISYGQFGQLDMIEIRIHSNDTNSNISVKLLREGLVYNINLPEREAIAKFIPHTELAINKLYEIQLYTHLLGVQLEISKYIPLKKYIVFKNFKGFKKYGIETFLSNQSFKIRNQHDDHYLTKRKIPIEICFIELRTTNGYHVFDYWYYDKDIDKLIKLIIKLIPQEDRKNFKILRIEK